MTSILGAARRRGAVELELRALADAVNTRCEPPLPEADLDRLARSIARYEPDDLDVARLVVSVETDTTSPPLLEFVTPAGLQAAGVADIDYVLPPYFIAGTLTDLTGAAKIGKTRLRNYFIRCAVTGASCLGEPAMPPAAVVLLTEEPPAALLEGLRAAGLMATRALSILTRHAARTTDWPDIVAAAMDQAPVSMPACSSSTPCPASPSSRVTPRTQPVTRWPRCGPFTKPTRRGSRGWSFATPGKWAAGWSKAAGGHPPSRARPTCSSA